MLRYIVLFFIIFCGVSVHGQSKVVWEFAYDKAEEAIIANATIDEGWHLYSQFVDEYAGPVPTSFDFQENSQVVFIGTPEEPKAIVEFDENFESEVAYFVESVQFKQKIEFKENTKVSGSVTFMVCNDVMCLPPEDQLFIISIEH